MGGAPFYLKFWVHRPPLERNAEITDIQPIFACTTSAVTPSEKSSINANWKSTTRFPMSLIRLSLYVVSKPQKGLKNSTCDCSKIYYIHITLNLNNSTFQLKTLLFFVHLRSQQKRTESHIQLSNSQGCQFDIVILRVAIISNVQNVRLQRRHRSTDDASTRRWRGSQQTGPYIKAYSRKK